jgi:hypothetical protein
LSAHWRAFEQSAYYARMIDHLRADPREVATWSILADAFSDVGHPRGELIAIDLKLEQSIISNQQKQAYRERRSALMRTHEAVFLGEQRLLGDFFLEWRRGFIHKAISPAIAVHPDCLSALWPHPSSQLLDSLELFYDDAPVLFSGRVPSLKSLHLHPRKSNGERPLAPSFEKPFPYLESLHLVAPAEDLRHLRHSTLKSLEVSDAICLFGEKFAERFPKLQELALFGVSTNEGISEPSVLIGPSAPASLKALSLGAMVLAPPVLRELSALVQKKSIERVDLSSSELSPLGVRPFLEFLEALPRLKAFAPPRYRYVPSRLHRELKAAEQAYRHRQKGKVAMRKPARLSR